MSCANPLGLDRSHPAQPHLSWARGIARQVRQSFRFQAGSQESYDLEQVAYRALLEALNRYDPVRHPPIDCAVNAFRGYAKKGIRQECRREALRLRNGGLFCTTQTPNECPRVYQGGASHKPGEDEDDGAEETESLYATDWDDDEES